MQKIQKKAYILLWSIFLSLIIGISFLSISSQIAKNLKENNDLKNKISTNNKINNKINDSLENNNFENIELSKNELIIFEKSNYYNIGLNENQEISIRIVTSGNMTIRINKGSPIYYYNPTNTNISGEVITVSTFLTGNNRINIRNLGGYSNIDIMAEENFLTDRKKYQILKKIGNKNIIKQKGEIKLIP